MKYEKAQKRVAIMQPYLFPYVGYFQLISAVDEFWLLDDVQFKKGGWMNRNRLRINNSDWLFTIPLKKHSYTDRINQVWFSNSASQVLKKLNKTLTNSYRAAPYIETAIMLVSTIIDRLEDGTNTHNFADIAHFALLKSCEVVGIKTPVNRVSDLFLENDLAGSERVIAACHAIGSTTYINMINGRHLYCKKQFRENGIELFFLRPNLAAYPQCGPGFIPGLSIIDAVANVEPSKMDSYIGSYSIF